jgi:hypothetical protein
MNLTGFMMFAPKRLYAIVALKALVALGAAFLS